MQAHYLSIKGLEQLIRTISNVKRKINSGLEIAGILITMADLRTTYSREIIELLRDSYGDKLRITVMEAILKAEHPTAVQVVLKQARLHQYFPSSYTNQQMEEVIASLLEAWSVQHSKSIKE